MQKINFIYVSFLILIFPAISFSHDNSSSDMPSNQAVTGNTIDMTKTGNKAYTNKTTTPYNQKNTNGETPGTGPSSGNTNHTGTMIYNNGTGTNVPREADENTPQSHNITVKNFHSWQASKILKYAIASGAQNPRIENGTIIYWGNDFDPSKFERLLTTYDSSISVSADQQTSNGN